MFNQRRCRDAGRVGGRLPQVWQLLPPHGITLPLSIISWKQPYSHALGINWGTQWLKKSSTGRQHQRWGGVYWLCSLCGALPKYLAGFNNFHCFPWYIRSTVGKQDEQFSGRNFILHTSRAIVMQDPSEEVRYSVMGQALADVRKVLCL